MFDFSAYIQNEWSWAVLALMAIFVGMSKTGITRMPKLAFVGNNAWFFLCVNFLKLPFQLFAWHNINLTTLAIDACAIPFVLIGAFVGIFVFREPATFWRLFFLTTLIASIVGLKTIS